MKRAPGGWLVLTLFLFPWAPAEGGSLAYPAFGNLCPRRGTIECWLIPQVELTEGDMLARAYWRYPLLRAEGNGFSFQLAWLIKQSQSGPAALHDVGKTKLTHYAPVKRWRKGEARHIAYCWDEGVDWWVIDGVETPKQRRREWHGDAVVDVRTRLVLGLEILHGQFVIDDLRISSVARRADEVGFHAPGGLVPDAWTLLLDDFDGPGEADGVRRTSPRTLTPGADGQAHGFPDRHCAFVPGVRGGGVRL